MSLAVDEHKALKVGRIRFLRPVFTANFIQMLDMGISPFCQSHQYRSHFLSILRDGVLHFRGDLPIYFSMHNIMILKLSQLGSQHFFGNERRCPLQFAKPHRSIAEQLKQNDRFPFSHQYFERGLRTPVTFLCQIKLLLLKSKHQGIYFDTMYALSNYFLLAALRYIIITLHELNQVINKNEATN